MSRYLSMRKGEIRDVDDTLANKLIADGVAEQYKLIEPTGKITITENGNGIDVSQYAEADVNVAATPQLVARSTTGLSGFTDEMIEEVLKVRGCVKVEVLSSLGGQELPVSAFTHATYKTYQSVTSVLLPVAVSGMGSAIVVLAFEKDEGDPESPIYSASIDDAATNMGGSWVDISSALTISAVTIYSVEVEE